MRPFLRDTTTATGAVVLALLSSLSSLVACASPVAPPPVSRTNVAPPVASAPLETRPTMRLPAGVRPIAETIALTIKPEDERFTGKVDIDVAVERSSRKLWLHARGLHVSVATITPSGASPIAATWGDEDDHGLGALTAASEVPAGRATIHIEYDAPFMAGTRGLFKTKEAGVAYAFTQFEAIDARRAFPCFDEPGFKIPFTVTLDVKAEDQAIANTPEIDRTPLAGGLARVRFAPTKPLPSYLVAFAVGPLDVVKGADVPPNAVRARPLAMRGVAAKGRGKELTYALAHAGEILATLESYFGIAYPYEKMDVLAVPDLGGAMENAGAVTFAEGLVLLDEKTAPISQKLSFAVVVAHEFAHQWFGDLVTMQWWDDLWLNESFAEWMGYKAADLWNPALHADLEIAGQVDGAIGTDSLVHARQIHQPVDTSDDIENAFDGITYQKGAGVITMFERWLGADVFQKGVRQHLSKHSFANATLDDFLGALSTAAGKDVATPFRTFLDQPGVPFVEASVECAPGAPTRVRLTQSRYLPLGSSGDANKLWQIPVCAKYADAADGAIRESCTLLTSQKGELALDAKACPAWLLPNANGVGYYRFSLASADLAKLRDHALPKLTTREKITYGNSIRASYRHGATTFSEALTAAAPLANDPDARVAAEPGGFVSSAHDWLFAEPVRASVESYARTLYAAAYAKLGWERKRGESDAVTELRAGVIAFLTRTGEDPKVRAEAKRRALAYIGYRKDGAIHREAVDQNLAALALVVAGEDADAPLFDAMLALLAKTQDDVVRGIVLGGLASARDPALAARARALVLDDRVKFTEMLTPLYAQLESPETRDATWAWEKDHWDAVTKRASGAMFAGIGVIGTASAFCDEAHESDVPAFLNERAAKIDGGPRVLRTSVEAIHLCVAQRKASAPDARRFFSGGRGRSAPRAVEPAAHGAGAAP